MKLKSFDIDLTSTLANLPSYNFTIAAVFAQGKEFSNKFFELGIYFANEG